MPHPLNVIDHPVCLAFLERRAVSSWLEHAPFAMWLTSALKPRVLVELGTYYGTSYCAFCQAIDALGLSTRAFAVDTWQGDPHNGWYSPDVLDDLRRHHDPRYAGFSTLLRMTFDEARPRFADKEIDLIHIDGYHTYEVVRHDFETWLPKLSDRGIILFHDVAERAADFGVWRLWNELRAQYRSFTFLHEHGLGVLAPGPDVPDEVSALLELRDPDIQPVRTIFHEMGRRLRLAVELEAGLIQRDAARRERDAHRAERDHALLSLGRAEERLAGVQKDWAEFLSSQSWRAFHQLRLAASRIGPEGTRRRSALKRVARLVEAVGCEGALGFARRQVRQAINGTRPARRMK
jgi:O-antigen biosynthesis protein